MLYWFDHVGLLLCQFFYHIYKCSLNFFSNIKHWICELIFSWPLVPLGPKPFLNHKGSTCHVLKCIPSCKLPDNPANVNKKVICSKCWITHRNGRQLERKSWKRVGLEVVLGFHVAETSPLSLQCPLLGRMRFKHYFCLLSRFRVLGSLSDCPRTGHLLPVYFWERSQLDLQPYTDCTQQGRGEPPNRESWGTVTLRKNKNNECLLQGVRGLGINDLIWVSTQSK